MSKTILTPPPQAPAAPSANGQKPLRRGLSLQQTFSALRHRNYRLWFAGQLVSLVGTWMQTTAQGYLIYELTGSPAYLGYVGFAAGLPTWLFTLFGGVIADRMPRRNLMVITQSAMMVLAALLAALTYTNVVQPWHIIGLAFLLGTANAFDAPARQAFVLEMVSREDMTNAIALNSTMFNSATAIGPAVAGITYALLGPATCFLVNSVSFLAVIVALLLMRLAPMQPARRNSSAVGDIVTGLRYVSAHSVIRVLIAGIGMASLFAMGYVTLLPAWAVKVLGGNVTTNGLLQSARGVGALLGALMIAWLGSSMPRGRLLTLGSFVLPASLFVFAAVRWLPLSLLVLVIGGWGFMIFANLSNSMIQTEVPDELRGRVMSIFTLSFFGLFPVGALLAGWAATHFGEPLTVVLGGTGMLAYALLQFWRFPNIRRVV
ncbi:MAG: MFS transporter [Chloroflexota bacterium]|nr:MAG: MFS transporter [Chloroflexota bacterium]